MEYHICNNCERKGICINAFYGPNPYACYHVLPNVRRIRDIEFTTKLISEEMSKNKYK